MFDFQEKVGLTTIKDLVEGEQNLSRIYGFILYTRQNPYVAKVLSDRAFWDALDSLSGDNWPIFAVRPLQQGSWSSPRGGGRNSMSFMVMTWNEPDSNIPILEEFGIEDTKNLPLFVAFMWDDEDNLQQITVPIQGHDENSVYNSLETIVKTISEVEGKVEDSFKRSVSVFREVKENLEALNFKIKWKKFQDFVGRPIAGLFLNYIS